MYRSFFTSWAGSIWQFSKNHLLPQFLFLLFGQNLSECIFLCLLIILSNSIPQFHITLNVLVTVKNLCWRDANAFVNQVRTRSINILLRSCQSVSLHRINILLYGADVKDGSAALVAAWGSWCIPDWFREGLVNLGQRRALLPNRTRKRWLSWWVIGILNDILTVEEKKEDQGGNLI